MLDEPVEQVVRRGVHAGPHQVACLSVVAQEHVTQEVVGVLRAAGAQIAAAGSIVDRSESRADLGVPYACLWTASAPSWKPEDCPLCQAGTPLVKPGSRGLESLKEPKHG